MAHHVARLITEAEQAQGGNLEPAQERCRRAILDLWKARHAIFHRAPMATMEDIGAAVHALNTGDGWFFNRMPSEDDPAAPQPIQFARGVDQTARAIIRMLVGDAVRQGLAQESEWLWLTHSQLPDIKPIIVLFEEAIVTASANTASSSVEVEEDSAADKLRAEREVLVAKLRALAATGDEMASYLLS